MDRALKERIIGAVVLVAVVVLVVPVFLDGPPTEGETVSERVPLPGQTDQKTQTVVLNRDREDPVPAPAGQADDRSTSQPSSPVQPSAEDASRAAAPAPEPAGNAAGEPPQTTVEQARVTDRPTPVPAQAAASSTGMWAVQLGSFSQADNAEKLAAGLRKQGFAAFLSQLETESGQLHRVRIGPQKDREAAEAMAARLAAAGHPGQVVPHP